MDTKKNNQANEYVQVIVKIYIHKINNKRIMQNDLLNQKNTKKIVFKKFQGFY